jgi:branched-chain amino acid transport system ATP-binding protein
MLEVNNITVKYGELTALRDLSLKVDRGEIVALLGANGVGKSTTLSAICGLLPVSEGSIAFKNKSITNIKPNKIVEMGLSMIPEGRHLFPRLSAEENLILGAYTADGVEIRERLEQIYGLFPPFLRERKHNRADRFSGGEQQMIAIARGLMSKPDLLMLDEPSQGLMPILIPTILEILKEINRQGVTVLLVEQRVREALQIADRGYILQNGRVVLEGRSEDLIGNEMVKKAYLGM